MVLIDEFYNDKGTLIRREINGKLEEVIEPETSLTRIVERATDLDGNEILLQIRGQIKLVKVYEFMRDDSGHATELSVYDYQDGRQKFQGVLGKVRCINLGEGRGIELVEETKNNEGVVVFRVLNEIDLSNPAWYRHSGIEDQMSPTKVRSSKGKFTKGLGSPERHLYTDGDKKDGFFEECVSDKGEKTRFRLRGVLKVGIADGKRILVEEGLDKDGQYLVRPIFGEIINPNCTTLNPGLLEIYQSPSGDEMSRYITGELKILIMDNGRFLVEQKKENEDGGTPYTLRRIIEGYIHCNDKCENRTCIIEKVKDKNGYTNNKRIYGCLRNYYDGNQGVVIEEYLGKKDEIKTRYINGVLWICRMSDLPIELKDKTLKPEIFTSNKDARHLLHKHLDTLNALGRFTVGLMDKTKLSPRTYLPGSTNQKPEKYNKSRVELIEKRTGGFVHIAEENIEYGDNKTDQPSYVQPAQELDTSQQAVDYRLKIEQLLGTNLTMSNSRYGEHRDMIANYLKHLRLPAGNKEQEAQNRKDERIIEEYLERIKIPATTPEQIEERRRDEELIARYLSEVNHSMTAQEKDVRRQDADMLLHHFARYGRKWTNKEEEIRDKKIDEQNVQQFLAHTKPTVREEYIDKSRDHELLAKYILKQKTIDDVTPQQQQKEQDTENLLSKAMLKFKYIPKTEDGKRKRRRDEDLIARFLARKKIEPANAKEAGDRRREEEWITKYIERMNSKKIPKTVAEKEQARQEAEWIAKFMERTRPELEQDQHDEDERRRDERLIANFLGRLEIQEDKEVEVSDKERRNDAALIARFLRPRPKNETDQEAERHDHTEEVIMDYLNTHTIQRQTTISNADKQDSSALKAYMDSLGYKTDQKKIDNPHTPAEEPQFDNIVIGGQHKKAYGALTSLIPKETSKTTTTRTNTIINSEVIYDQQQPVPNYIPPPSPKPQVVTKVIKEEIKMSPKDSKKMLDHLREMEERAARMIQRRWRHRKWWRMVQRMRATKTDRYMSREKFEDLYVRFMMFLDGLPYDADYEDLFRVFLFYLDESRNKRWRGQVYTSAERKVYIREQYENFKANQDKGRSRSRTYLTESKQLYKF